MVFVAEIDVMPLAEILDPQGKAVRRGLENLGVPGVADVRVGKHLTLTLEADSEADAEARVQVACQQLLANLIMESYTFRIRGAH